MNILIAGCGKIGTALGLALIDLGHQVFGLRRTPMPSDSKIHWIQADLNQAESLKSLPTQIDAVFYAASANAFTKEAYTEAYINGVKHLQQALKSHPPCPVFYISSTAVYDLDDGSWVDETTPCQPRHFSGDCVLQGEQAWDWPITVIRAAGIYGPDRQYFLESIRQGQIKLSPKPIYTNRIHSEDLVRFLVHLFNLPHRESCYIACDDEPTEKNIVIQWLAEQIGVNIPAVTQAEQEPQRGNKRCSNQRLHRSGYQLKYPHYRDGYSQILSLKNIN